jgi:hypothetical protein
LLSEVADVDAAGFHLCVDERFDGIERQRVSLFEQQVPWGELNGAEVVHADADAASGGVSGKIRAVVKIEVEGA